MPNNQHVYATFCLMFRLMSPIYIPQPVIHSSTGWHGCLFVKEESGINAYCYDAMNDMTDFYSINTLWNPEQSAMEYTVNGVFSTGLDS